MSDRQQFTVGQDTNRGLVREENQDDFGWLTTQNGELLLVADGMGGSEGGRLAAETAINGIRTYFDEQSGPITEILRQAIQHANSEVNKAAARDSALADMGTTIVALVIKDGLAYTGHVGDSRIYLHRKNTLTRLTRDHSKVQKLVDKGEITEEEAETHEDAHLITRCIGCDKKVEADVRPDPIIIQPGDTFLLCSDGLSSLVRDEEISRQLDDRTNSPNQTCRDLVALALERGGHDNVTVQLIRFSGSQAPVSPLQDREKQHPATVQPGKQTIAQPGVAPTVNAQSSDSLSTPVNNRKNMFIAGAASLFLLVLLLAAGGYLLLRDKPEPDPEQQSHQQTPAKQTQPTAVPKITPGEPVEPTLSPGKKTEPPIEQVILPGQESPAVSTPPGSGTEGITDSEPAPGPNTKPETKEGEKESTPPPPPVAEQGGEFAQTSPEKQSEVEEISQPPISQDSANQALDQPSEPLPNDIPQEKPLTDNDNTQ